MEGGGAPVPWGRRHWIGINVCHPEVMKLQQQCQCRILFLIYPTTGSILFFSGRGRVPIYPGDRNRRIGRKNENDNPVRKWYICSSIITLIFGFFMTLGCHSWFRHVPGETGTTCKKAVLMLLFPREIQGI